MTETEHDQATRPPFGLGWTVHGDGRTITAGTVVGPQERLSWGRTVGIGVQHVMAMFGATVLVPALTGMPATTALFFSGLGTLLFLVITGNRLPSYLGSSFAFLAPIAAVSAGGGSIEVAMFGVLVTGVVLAMVGVVLLLAVLGVVSAVAGTLMVGGHGRLDAVAQVEADVEAEAGARLAPATVR